MDAADIPGVRGAPAPHKGSLGCSGSYNPPQVTTAHYKQYVVKRLLNPPQEPRSINNKMYKIKTTPALSYSTKKESPASTFYHIYLQ
ncbi:MAG: hypothetical protein PHP72_08315 [Dysgonamonadaceae bacterium]|nr:hypothetical protein [Dysgonamonadaceae bacterium]